MKLKKLIFLSYFILSSLLSYCQHQKGELTCLFYNLENLFHPSDDENMLSDDEFTPQGVRYWNFYRYNKKITQVCKVILASNEWKPPEIICLCELENIEVLQDIVRHPLLMKFDYRIIHRDSPDHRGIDVGMLYQKDKLNCIDTTWLICKDDNNNVMNTREILCAWYRYDKDTILVSTNHWISKYGGNYETEEKRILQARLVGIFLDSCISAQAGLSVIVGGDFNDNSASQSIQTLQDHSLHELVPDRGDFTYKYQGKWESIDHIFIGGNLHPGNCSATVVKNEFLLEADEKYTGIKPFRTYIGYTYHGGISDHLPLMFQCYPGKPPVN